jgi:hypothetical protein
MPGQTKLSNGIAALLDGLLCRLMGDRHQSQNLTMAVLDRAIGEVEIAFFGRPGLHQWQHHVPESDGLP